MPVLVGLFKSLPLLPYHPIGADTKPSGGNCGGKANPPARTGGRCQIYQPECYLDLVAGLWLDILVFEPLVWPGA